VKKTVVMVIIVICLFAMITGCSLQSETNDDIQDPPVTEARTPQVTEAPTVTAPPGNKIVMPESLWLQIYLTPEISAELDMQQLQIVLDAVIETDALALGHLFRYEELVFEEFSENTLLRMSIEHSGNTRKASFIFTCEHGELAQKQLYDYLHAKLQEKLATINSVEGENGGRSLFGAYNDGLFTATLHYRESTGFAASVDLVFETVGGFTYIAPDNLYQHIAYDSAALARIVPRLQGVMDGSNLRRYIYTMYGAIEPDSNGQVSVEMVMNHEFPDKDEPDDNVQQNGVWIMDTFGAANNRLGVTTEYWSVGLTPYTLDLLSPLAQRSAIDSLIPVVNFGFTTFHALNTVTSDYTRFQAAFTPDTRTMNSVESIEWVCLSYDRDAAVEVYRQLIVAFVEFYMRDGLDYELTVQNREGSRMNRDITPVLLLPYYSEAINSNTIDFTNSVGDSHSVSLLARGRINDEHPALNISGVEMNIRYSADTGRYAIRVNFITQPSGFVIPDSSTILQ
jgi:hypothetical protein